MNNKPTKSKCDRTPTKSKCDRTPTPTLREKFEEWAESKNFSLPKGNKYISVSTEIAWEAWQAASKELATLTEQLTAEREQLKETKKRLKDANRGAEINAHALRINADKLATVTEQRDELLRYNESFRQDTLICADCDAISKEEYDRAIEQRDGLRSAVDYASDQLTRVTEQRDRLAEELKNIESATAKKWEMPTDEFEYEFRRWAQSRAKQALQSINQPNEP